ncbi:MAG: hypothetical protein K2I18_06535 [Paramuribaculum sp.]|nr:hypothetical protein [Paramuribaculum sp.]
MCACSNSAKTTGTDASATDSTEQVAENQDAAEGQWYATEATAAEPVIELATGTTELQKSDKVIFLDFNAEWCGPCQRFKPIFHKVAGENASKAVFISVNTDSCPDIAAKYNVSSIPQIVAVKTDGTSEYAPAGYMEYETFNEFVQNQLK